MKKYFKNFDEWNKQKKLVQENESVDSSDFFFHEREVWWSSLGVNVGIEMDGKNDNFERPVLVLRKMNGKQFFGAPITSKDKTGAFYVDIVFGEENAKGKVCLSQIRVFSTKRLLRKIGMVDKAIFLNIKKNFVDLFFEEYK